MESNFQPLKAHIISLSNSDTFIDAKSEWGLVSVELHHSFTYCPCGKRIKEVCHIGNRYNGNLTHVGNVCINNFIGISTDNLFPGLKRIAQDIKANANEDVLFYAQSMGYLYEREYDFMISICHKRKLSDKQRSWKEKIIRRILSKTVVRTP